MSKCAPYVEGILSFDNRELIANGVIPQRIVTENEEEIKVIPADRLAVEMHYSVQAPSGGSFQLFGGFLPLSPTILGLNLSFAQTESRFTFHLCSARTRINVPIRVTESMLEEAFRNDGRVEYELADYPLGIMAVTRIPIPFTDEQLETIGKSNAGDRGLRPDSNGLLDIGFKDAGPNLCEGKIIDQRKFDFRADNYIPNDESIAFEDNNQNDLVDRKIQLVFPEGLLGSTDREPGEPLPDEKPEEEPLLPGDNIYITYISAKSNTRYVRQGVYIRSFWVELPFFVVERVSNDEVNAWSYRPYKWRILKDHNVRNADIPVRANIDDISRDFNIRSDPFLTPEQKERRINMEDIEGQRLVEVLNATKTRLPYIPGFFFADARGIVAVHEANTPLIRDEVIIPRSAIPNQDWFDNLLDEIVINRPGFLNGELILDQIDRANNVLQGFVFDVSDHVNATCFDNEKYGYQRQLASAIQNYTDPEGFEGDGFGWPNLDLVINRVEGREAFDLTSAKFEPLDKSSNEAGAYFVRDCNKFATNGSIQADQFFTSPFFFDAFDENTRVFIERWGPQAPLEIDGDVWVFSRPFAPERFSVDEYPDEKSSMLVFNKPNADGDSTLRFIEFQDFILRRQIQRASSSKSDISKSQNEENLNHEVAEVESVLFEEINEIGYDLILGNQPGYSAGKEISTDGGKIALGKESPSSLYSLITMSISRFSSDEVRLTGTGDRKIKNIKILFTVKPSYFDQTNKSLAITFPNFRAVIDSIPINWIGQSSSDSQSIIIDMRNYADSSINLIGPILDHVNILAVEAVVFQDDAYDKCKIISSSSSVCIDRSGNVFVFYEDDNASDGDFESSEVDLLDASVATDISCLMSKDEGDSWIDFKGVVNARADEELENPVAICDKDSNIIHLFFLLEGNLCHKSIDPSNFKAEDAFRAYRRSAIDAETLSIESGLFNFSPSGRGLRSSPIHVIVADYESDFTKRQLSITQNLSAQGQRSRFVFANNRIDATDGLSSRDFFAFQDKKGNLSVLYVVDGAVYVNVSGDEGESWTAAYNVDDQAVLLHRSSIIEEPGQVSRLGGLYDPASHTVYLTYIADGMMFMKSINADLFRSNNPKLEKELRADTSSQKSFFVTGEIPGDIQSILLSDIDGNSVVSTIVFPYPKSSLASFDQRMSISPDTPSVGYISSSGILRMFYRDFTGNTRGLTFEENIFDLDVKRRDNA